MSRSVIASPDRRAVRSCQSYLHCLGLLLVLVSNMSLAQDARIRASLSSEGSLWVGQEVTLVIELLAPGYFASAASFDLPDPAGVLLMPPGSHPMLSNETLDGTLYTVQRHELRAFPMRAGTPSIPPVTVRFSFKRAPLAEAGEPVSLSTEAIALAVNVPPGAESLGTVISARKLEVSEHWEPQPGSDNVVAGTAFTRTIRFTAPDVPGMLFPPFPAETMDGLGVYRKQQLLDHEERGSLIGARNDVITYVCKRPGQFTIPATRFSWFDLASQQIRVEDFPEQVLNVVTNPALAAATTDANGTVPAQRGRSWTQWPMVLIPVFVVLTLMVMLVVLFLHRNPALGLRLSRFLQRVIVPLRPVHLQPLNPSGPGKLTDK